MEIQPTGLSYFENSFTTKLARQLSDYKITQNDFSLVPDNLHSVPVAKIAGIDLTQYSLDPSKEYYVSLNTARELVKDYF